MQLALPEELSKAQVHSIVSELKDNYPKVFADCVDVFKMTPFQKLKVLDNVLMDHAELYYVFFKQEPER